MTLIDAIILGVVQGVAEFLPVSSSGHLAIFKHILGSNLGDMNLIFDVLLHFGTLLAIFIAFWKDIKKLVSEGLAITGDVFINIFRFISTIGTSKKALYKKLTDTPYRKFVILIMVSSIPTGIMGVALSGVIEAASLTLVVPGICLLITAVLLLIADYTKQGKKRPNQVSYAEAGIIGVAQGFATMPGLSRSGTTITACLLCGFDKNFAVKYSFIMSIPAVIGASLLELRDFPKSVDPVEMVNYVVGMVIAAVVGYICIKTMLVIVRGKKFKYFAYYCFIMGAISIIWHFYKGA